MKLNDINERLMLGPVELSGKCCDCGVDVHIKAELSGMNLIIDGGAAFHPPAIWNCPEDYMFKCPACFKTEPKFFPKTEVYTRCVGYLRPVNQMNPGKVAEINQRAMFNIQGI